MGSRGLGKLGLALYQVRQILFYRSGVWWHSMEKLNHSMESPVNGISSYKKEAIRSTAVKESLFAVLNPLHLYLYIIKLKATSPLICLATANMMNITYI